jgi:hypothetical protein
VEKKMNPQLKVTIRRDAKIITYPFTNYFKKFDKVEAVQHLFGEQTEEVLNGIKVTFYGRVGYMGVSSANGNIRISAHYMKNGDLRDIYLDIIHELVHVKQFMEGKELRDRNFMYVERPTEIEAYRYAVKEAKRLGMDDKEILEYLRTERMSKENLMSLAKIVNINVDKISEKN